MRTLVLLTLLVAPAAAKGYRFEDPLFRVAYALPGLAKGLPPSDPAMLFRGRAGGVRVEILVHESPEPLDAAAWTKRVFGEAGRGEDHRIEKRMPLGGIFEEWHGHALSARGLHCFEVHAWGDERTPVRHALDGLAVGPDEGAGLLARRLALAQGKDPLDPALLLEAGVEYATGRRFRIRSPALAHGLLARARRLARPEDLTPEQRWTLFQTGGLVLEDRPQEAAEWFRRAEEAAAKLEKRREERAARSAYHLARALARNRNIDEAFAALERAYAQSKPVTDGVLSSDRALENLRRDARWHDLWKRRVKGR